MGMGDEANKPMKRREVIDRLEEIDQRYTAQQNSVNRRLSKLETDYTDLSDFCHDVDSIICYLMGISAGENGKLNLKEIAGWSKEIERLKKELDEKKQESEEINRKLMMKQSETDNLRKKQAEQESIAEKLREKLEEQGEEAEKWRGELLDEQRKVKELDEKLKEKTAESEELNKELTAIKAEIPKWEEELAAEKQTEEAARTEIKKLQSELQDLAETKKIEAQRLDDMLKSKQNESEHYQSENIKIQNSVKELYKKNQELKQKKEEAELLFGKTKRQLEELKAKNDELEEKLEETSKEIDRLRTSIDSLKDEKIAETNALKQDLLHEQDQIRQYQDKFGCWKEETKDYQVLLEAVFACDSLAVMMEDYGLIKNNGSEDVANLIHFVNLLGDQASFLPILYDYLEYYKERNRVAVSQAEKELFDCLNSYYRKTYDVSSDLIRYPQEGDKFEKTQMRDFDNRTKEFRFIECVYVPSVMRDEINYLKLALVKGVF